VSKYNTKHFYRIGSKALRSGAKYPELVGLKRVMIMLQCMDLSLDFHDFHQDDRNKFRKSFHKALIIRDRPYSQNVIFFVT
jgi:hypothetical protein